MNGPKVGDVLRRKMFAPKQYTRKDAVGLMASSPELVQAVQRRRHGGMHVSSGGGFEPQQIAPPALPVVPAPIIEAPDRGTPDVTTNIQAAVPSAISSPASRPSVRNSTVPATIPQLKQISMAQMLKAAQSNKTAAEFLKENKDLLDKNAPLPKGRDAKDYLTKYFLDIAAAGAAGQELIPALAGQAPKNFDDYLTGKKEEETSEYERNLLALTMGITDKKAQDAANQALNLKILEIEGDQPEKIKQINALAKQMMVEDSTLTLTEATKMARDKVFQGNADQLSLIGYENNIAAGFSPFIAGFISNPAQSKFLDRVYADSLLRTMGLAGGLTVRDVQSLSSIAGYSPQQEAQALAGEPIDSQRTTPN